MLRKLVMGQYEPFHNFTLHFSKIHCNITLLPSGLLQRYCTSMTLCNLFNPRLSPASWLRFSHVLASLQANVAIAAYLKGLHLFHMFQRLFRLMSPQQPTLKVYIYFSLCTLQFKIPKHSIMATKRQQLRQKKKQERWKQRWKQSGRNKDRKNERRTGENVIRKREWKNGKVTKWYRKC